MRRLVYFFIFIPALLGGCAPAPTDSFTEGLPASSAVDGTREPDSLSDAAASCRPVVHKTQGFQANHEIQRYRIVGAAADGKRLAVLFSHFGPSSLDPFVNFHIFQEGSSAPLYSLNRVNLGGGPNEAALTRLEEHVMTEVAPQFARFGVDVLTTLPAAAAFCQRAEAVSLKTTDRGIVPATFSTVRERCPSSPGSQQTKWRLCLSGSTLCIAETPDLCDVSEVRLVDIFQRENVLWVVGERKLILFGGSLIFYLRSVAGRSR